MDRSPPYTPRHAARGREPRTPAQRRPARHLKPPPEGYVRLRDPLLLAAYMTAARITVRDLARHVELATGQPCSPATIGHLRSGERDLCTTETARALTWLLATTPREPLFPDLPAQAGGPTLTPLWAEA